MQFFKKVCNFTDDDKQPGKLRLKTGEQVNILDLVRNLCNDDKRWLLPGNEDKNNDNVFVPIFGGHVMFVLYHENGNEAFAVRNYSNKQIQLTILNEWNGFKFANVLKLFL